MSLRQSLSGFRKKAKDKLSKIGDRIERRRAGVGGEGFDRPNSPLEPEPIMGVEGEPGGDIGVGKGDSRTDDSRFVSWPVVEGEREPGGSDNYDGQQERVQEDLHLRVRMQAGRGPSQERRNVGGNRVSQVGLPSRSRSDIGNATTPTTSDVLQGGEPEGM